MYVGVALSTISVLSNPWALACSGITTSATIKAIKVAVNFTEVRFFFMMLLLSYVTYVHLDLLHKQIVDFCYSVRKHIDIKQILYVVTTKEQSDFAAGEWGNIVNAIFRYKVIPTSKY